MNFQDRLALQQWNNLLPAQDINSCYDVFIQTFLYLYNESFPVVTQKLRIDDLITSRG
jgi:hypothetical protein